MVAVPDEGGLPLDGFADVALPDESTPEDGSVEDVEAVKLLESVTDDVVPPEVALLDPTTVDVAPDADWDEDCPTALEELAAVDELLPLLEDTVVPELLDPLLTSSLQWPSTQVRPSLQSWLARHSSFSSGSRADSSQPTINTNMPTVKQRNIWNSN